MTKVGVHMKGQILEGKKSQMMHQMQFDNHLHHTLSLIVV